MFDLLMRSRMKETNFHAGDTVNVTRHRNSNVLML